MKGLKEIGQISRHFLCGLMKVGDEPFVIEYNVRMGDPECQTILPKLKTDLLKIFLACCNQTLNQVIIRWKTDKSLCVVLCSKGYPEKYKKNLLIKNLDKIKVSDL